jgi:hypothetical protein
LLGENRATACADNAQKQKKPLPEAVSMKAVLGERLLKF